jgi:hypothetical protein
MDNVQSSVHQVPPDAHSVYLVLWARRVSLCET